MIEPSEQLVSVVICNFNYDQFLRQAIESVLTQTYQNIQVIIVDDGSYDTSQQILDSLKNERITLVFQKNQGQGSAFNAGVERCLGEYVAFLDSDDFWYPDKLAVSVPKFECKDLVLVQHNLDIVDKKSVKTGYIHPAIEAGRLNIQQSYFAHNHTGFFCPTSGLVCRKSAIDQIFPIKPEWKICADVAFTRPLPIFGDILTVPDILGAYRIHHNNGWMNGIKQTSWLENQQHYVEYTNQWLNRFGYKKEIEFERSDMFPFYSNLQYQQHRKIVIFKTYLKKLLDRIPGTRFIYTAVKRHLRLLFNSLRNKFTII